MAIRADCVTSHVTLADIAAHCGVTTAAVSYALNGRRGVSDVTRERIEKAADDLGWEAPTPPVRRQLHGGRVVGLLVPGTIEVLVHEAFTAQFIAGLTEALIASGSSLMLMFEKDPKRQMDIYRDWARLNVRHVVLLDVVEGDVRLKYLPRLGFEAVSTCPLVAPDSVPCVYTDDEAEMPALLRLLAQNGHRRFARVAGPATHSQVAARTSGWNRFFGASPEVLDVGTVYVDWVSQRAAGMIRQFLSDITPDVVIADSDRLTIYALRALRRLKHAIPADVSVIAFEDSVVCQDAGLAALNRDAAKLGCQAGLMALSESPRKRFVMPRSRLLVRRTCRGIEGSRATDD